ncbi:hypothetical protein A2U01_0085832, partial [Trifolium medium]|nr:hypothetical protein [Trifolium medium]
MGDDVVKSYPPPATAPSKVDAGGGLKPQSSGGGLVENKRQWRWSGGGLVDNKRED